MAEFSKEFSKFSLNFSETNQHNQSGRFPVLQVEELERKRSYIVNRKHVKKDRDMAECLRRVAKATPQNKKLEDILDLKSVVT